MRCRAGTGTPFHRAKGCRCKSSPSGVDGEGKEMFRHEPLEQDLVVVHDDGRLALAPKRKTIRYDSRNVLVLVNVRVQKTTVRAKIVLPECRWKVKSDVVLEGGDLLSGQRLFTVSKIHGSLVLASGRLFVLPHSAEVRCVCAVGRPLDELHRAGVGCWIVVVEMMPGVFYVLPFGQPRPKPSQPGGLVGGRIVCIPLSRVFDLDDGAFPFSGGV